MTAVEIGAKMMDEAAHAIMGAKAKDEEFTEIKDIAENLSSEIKLTREFCILIMQNFDCTQPNENNLRKTYFDTQTMGFVMLDRLMQMEDEASALVEKLYKH